MSRLFEIAVYRVSPEQWRAEAESEEATVKEGYLQSVPEGVEPKPESIEHHVRIWRRLAGRDLPHSYNDVVGWIRVEWAGPGPIIKAYAWKTSQKRIRRAFSHKYQWFDKIFELWFRNETSQEIAQKVRGSLLELTRGRRLFKGRYVDLKTFDFVGRHLDWRRAIGLEK